LKLEAAFCDLKTGIAMNKKAIALVKQTESKIQLIRGQKVILDTDLAELYGVPVRQLNQQIKRNFDRFPADFLFRLSRTEYENLRSQFLISSSSYGGRRYLPYAFTEHGAIMAATVLNSERAVEMSIFVVRAFVRMREVYHRIKRSFQNWESLSAVWRAMIPIFSS
jgi:hypothetical protein